jgi:hypothetical protein
MAAMMKAHAQNGAGAGGGAANPASVSPEMAAMMKAHAQTGPGVANPAGINPANPNAGGHAQAGAAGPGAIAGGGPAMVPGGGAGGPGGLGGQQFPPGSAEDATAKFCAAMADSNLTEAGQYISPKARGLLALIRDGSITDEKVESLKASFQGLTARPSRPVSGTGKTLSLGNANRESLSFTLVKEEDVYLLRELKITKATR